MKAAELPDVGIFPKIFGFGDDPREGVAVEPLARLLERDDLEGEGVDTLAVAPGVAPIELNIGVDSGVDGVEIPDPLKRRVMGCGDLVESRLNMDWCSFARFWSTDHAGTV
jgi:hypothetical protein